MNSKHISNDQRYFESYDQVQVHELMLRDRPRVCAYHDAIMNNKHLFENKVVLDVGSGTGILSMFAAKAGAKLVYAVDACPTICNLAAQLIQCNGLQDRVQIINKRVEEIDKFDEKIDIIISEWMGFYLFHESMLESVIYARDHFLRSSIQNDDSTSEQNESIVIFPSHAYLYCAPFMDQNIRIELNTMWNDYFNLNLSPIRQHIKNSDLSECVIETIEPSQLVHDAQLIQSIDLRTVRIDELQSMRSFCEFTIDNTCIISGFCFWFDCYFSTNDNSSILRSTRLTTNPSSPKTHWKQTLVFLPEDIYPLKNDIVPVNIKLKQSAANRRQYDLTISIKKIKENLNNNDETILVENLNNKGQRRRSSTMSTDKHITSESQTMDETSDSTSSESDNDSNASDEHPIPCSCDRERCKLIKIIIEKYDEENAIE
ncbi:unnamed protein product [Rotaria magnacalcarata]|uniref:type I protein arginine methyltransferase n=3 Tax=Rotaria magnacalcarata TaxID=392030 RepID=A0A816U3Y3_9BILA|nr:unnamed protein product [Rotaria magnacalcarata]CAF1655760.1 unnamed protein product [Rotaria magnacalcarata]CAF2048829.1 unnamed protein product [Rotaria magnacalcarata]CAF2109146.1 unnamed protein product [Rotaria magnacalcarata]CAF3960944.1 unnamed protein product [Rotaria magnacalcarata]